MVIEDILRAFPDAHISSGYARVRCPYHKNGQERRPSMSILLEQKGNAPMGLCHCFTCGKAVMFPELMHDLGLEYHEDNERPALPQEPPVTLTTTPVMHKTGLPYRKSAYLESRGIGEDVQRRFKVYEKNGFVHMPVFDAQGFYLYDNARSTTGKRFIVEQGASKTLWGMEEIDLSKPVAICESQINAMSLWQVGVQAVATLGADNIKALKPLLKCTSTIILAFDPDEAGIRARDRAKNMFGAFRCRWLDLPVGIDVNQALMDIKDPSKFTKFLNKCLKRFVQ